MTRFWMPPQTAPLANDLGIFLMQCPKNSLISAWPHNARPQWMMILQMSSGIGPVSGRALSSKSGRRLARRLAAPGRSSRSILITRGPIRVTVVLGRGKLAKIEVASNCEDTSEARGGAASEGSRLSWPRHPRCQVHFPPLRVLGHPSFGHPSFRARIRCCSGSKRCWRARGR